MFLDVSTSFKRLQAEKHAADMVIRELTPLEGTKDIGGLRDYLQNMNLKAEVSIYLFVPAISDQWHRLW